MGEDSGVKDKADFDNLIDFLLSAVAREIEVYKELRAVIIEETRVLMRPTVDLLNYSNAKKEACISKVRKLEKSRLDVVRQIAEFLDRKENEISLTFLFPYLAEDRRVQLESFQKILSPLIREINEVNEKNKGLLDFSLSYVRGSLNFISGLLSAGAGYESTGQLRPGNLDGRVLDSQG